LLCQSRWNHSFLYLLLLFDQSLGSGRFACLLNLLHHYLLLLLPFRLILFL
jgi:hypothetical protein